MAISNAERNRRKRERKKKQKDTTSDPQSDGAFSSENSNDEVVEIEYVPEPIRIPELLQDAEELRDNSDSNYSNELVQVLEKFQNRASILVSDSEPDDAKDPSKQGHEDRESGNELDSSDLDDDSTENKISKRQERLLTRPTIAQLKNMVQRPDLVEAHDICAHDPTFLLHLKSIPGTVSVPRHWGRKRKYLQGKRGTERVPYSLPDFIVKTGIAELRGSTQEDEAKQSAKQKNRARVAPKMGALDVDYRILHDAFFKHQNISHMRTKLTPLGDLYYEGKEFETHKHATSTMRRVGTELSDRLKEALAMTAANSPPPWLVNMQRYGPPPSYPNLKIPGLNAPLPNASCSYGYHLNGWGKPPVDAFNRPLYGGNPFDPPGGGGANTADWDYDAISGALVTSDGKTIKRKPWGALPTASMQDEEDESEAEEDSGDDMVESGDEEAEAEEDTNNAAVEESVVSKSMDEPDYMLPTSTFELRKTMGGEETPMPMERKNLYTILHQTTADKDSQNGAVFTSDIAYVMPLLSVPSGAESVVSKVMGSKDDGNSNKKRGLDDNAALELGKKFKF